MESGLLVVVGSDQKQLFFFAPDPKKVSIHLNGRSQGPFLDVFFFAVS